MPVDLSKRIPVLCARLNAAGAGDLVFWTEPELYQRMAEALTRLARRDRIFWTVGETIAVEIPQAVYLLPNNAGIALAALDAAELRPASVGELEARDSNWEQTVCVEGEIPTHWIGDYLGAGFIRLYPSPIATGELLILSAKLPDEPTAETPQARIPAPVADYLALAALQEARDKEGDARMPEVAQVCASIAALYEQTFAAYWGTPS